MLVLLKCRFFTVFKVRQPLSGGAKVTKKGLGGSNVGQTGDGFMETHHGLPVVG